MCPMYGRAPTNLPFFCYLVPERKVILYSKDLPKLASTISGETENHKQMHTFQHVQSFFYHLFPLSSLLQAHLRPQPQCAIFKSLPVIVTPPGDAMSFSFDAPISHAVFDAYALFVESHGQAFGDSSITPTRQHSV